MSLIELVDFVMCCYTSCTVLSAFIFSQNSASWISCIHYDVSMKSDWKKQLQNVDPKV